MACFTGRALGLLAAACFAATGCAKSESQGDVESEATSAKATTDGPVRLQLSASAMEYVQGQPIRLTLVMTNQRGTPFRFQRIPLGFWRPPCVFLSTDGKRFSPLEPEQRDAVLKIGLAEETLQPGGLFTCRLCLLSGWQSANGLALTSPGRLWLQVRYPVNEMSLDRPSRRLASSEVDSNAVVVRIREATGEDAEIWSVLREERFLRFLQTEQARDLATIREALELAKAHPASTYYGDLKASLTAYYDRMSVYDRNKEVQANPEWTALVEEIRQSLGIPRPEELPFPEDKRLDVRFECSFDGISLQDAYKRVSELTKIPLSLAPEFAGRRLLGGWRDRELRAFMRERASGGDIWIRDGDGYKLVPKAQKKEEKPAEESM